MRNLKRALSLALASVMLLGMMVVGTSAASYPDVDENDNVEAIEVLNAVDVMIGRQGNFEPDEAVNRHEMAVIMAKLVLGVDTADNYVGTHPFTDVVPWADKYVAACYENGLIAGTSATTYGGSSPLTAVQAAAMMLRALGYKDLSVGAQDWRAPVTAMANQIRLFDGVASNPSEKLNRNQVAQLALNTLKSPMVNLKDNTISWSNGDGQIIMTGGSREYIVLSSREAYAQAINRVESEGTSASAIAGYTVELGEHLYNGKLRLDDDTDVFLRPARTWQYDGKKIGTYVKEELLRATYSTEVTGKTLYDLLSKNTISKYNFTIAIDGVDTDDVNTMTGYFTKGNLVSTNTRGVGATGKGVTTEVYVDSVNGEVTIAVINTYLAKAAEKYNEKRDEVKFNVWGLEQKSGPRFLNKDTAKNPANTFPLVASGEDFDVKNVAKNDIVLVRVADNAIQEIIQPEVIDKTVLSSFSKGSWVNNGTKYDYANTARYDDKVLDQYSKPNMKELTYNLYLDEYGYMIGIERNEDPDQYVFLAGIDAGDSNLKATTADANVIHVDGTMKTVKVDMNKSTLPSYMSIDVNNSQLNTWCKYSVSTSGVYTLTEIDHNPAKGADTLGQFAQDVADYPDTGKTNKTITEKRTSLVASVDGAGKVTSWVYGNDDTKYINVELKGVVVKDNDNGSVPADATGIDYRRIIDDVDTVITGIKDVDLEMTNLPATQKNDKGVSEYINPDAEIYTLYKEGIVIAAVTIGEDNGSAATWAYITSKEPRQEDYYHETSSKAAEPGEWTWYREAVVDGKIVDLIEIGDSLTYIGNESDEGNMQQGEWWEIKVDADGNVRKSTLLSKVLGDRFQTKSKDVEETVNTESGDVVLQMDFVRADYKANKDTLTFKNGNLYTDSDLTKGFSVSRNVKVVLGQAQLKSGYDNGDGEKNWGDHGYKAYVDQWKYKDDIFEGYDGLKSVLDRLDANFVGDLNVIFHNGAATVIVINDIWGEYIDEGEYIGNKNNAKGEAKIEYVSGNDWVLRVTDPASVKTVGEIADYMAKAGCTEIVHTRYGWSFVDPDGIRNEDQDVTVGKLDDDDVYSDVTSAGWTTVQGNVLLNGEAELTDVKEGDTVTVIVTAKEGYIVPASVTVDNGVGTVALTDGVGTFKMPAKDTIVTVTFGNAGGGWNVEVKGTAGKGNHYSTDLPDSLQVAKGESFTITALKKIVVYDETGRNVVEAGDTYTVTPTSDVTVFINRTKWAPGENNSMTETEDKAPGTPAGVAVMAMFARAARTGETTDYQKMTIADVNGTDHEYIVKIVTGADGMRTIYFPSAESVQEACDILNAIDEEGGEFDPGFVDATDTEVEENWGEGDDSAADDRCQASIAADGTITLNVYADFEPTEGQIKAAIAEAIGDGLTSEDIIIDDAAVTIDGETGFTLVDEASYGELFKVQIGADDDANKIVKYALPDSSVSGLPTTIDALLPAAKLVGDTSDAIDVTSGTVADIGTLTADTKFMPALALWDGSSGAESGGATDGQLHVVPDGWTAYYADGKSTVWTPISTTNDKYIQVGVNMLFEATGAAATANTGMQVAGTDFTGVKGTDGALNVTVTGITKYMGELTEITFKPITGTPVASNETYTVKVNGKVVTNTAEGSEGKWKANDRVIMTTGVTESALIVGNYYESDGPTGAIATFVPASGKKEFVLTPAIVDLADENKVIELNGAYQVNTNSTCDITDAAETDAIATIADGSYVAAGRELTITAKAAGKILAAKDGSSYTLGDPDEAIVLTKTSDEAASWTIELTGDIASDEFENGMTLTLPADVSWKTADSTTKKITVAAASDGAATAAPGCTVVITGAEGDFSADMVAAVKKSAKWNLLGRNGDITELTVKAVTYATTTGSDTLTVTFENATDAALTMNVADSTADPAVAADTAVFQVKVGGATLQYTVTVTVGD